VNWTAIAAAYLIGGLPFSYWVVRWSRGIDLRLEGSHNPGATNALRVAGVGSGLVTLALDVLKGVAAIALARALSVPESQLGAVAFAAVAGHAFPVWLRFRGGKGVAAATGVYLSLVPSALAIALAVFLGVVAAGRVVALGSIAAAIAVPVAQWALDRWSDPSAGLDPMIGWSAGIAALVVARHRSNLSRLWTARRAGQREQEES
jgi:glycerol-3-phosphate acyltransferase PlsY